MRRMEEIDSLSPQIEWNPQLLADGVGPGGFADIPLGRPATPEEAAGGVFFLCSPWSNYVHGQVLNVTGGQFTGMTT